MERVEYDESAKVVPVITMEDFFAGLHDEEEEGETYLVFAGMDYHPAGGAKDFIGSATTLTDALRIAATAKRDWCHVAVLKDGKLEVVEEF